MHKIPEQCEILEKMTDLAAKRQKRNETIVLDKLPGLRTLSPGSIIGTFSYTDIALKKRYLKRSAVVDIGNGIQSKTEVTRDYLVARYGRLRGKGAALDLCREYRQFPIYVRPGFYQDFIYLDLSSAYYSIANVCGYNLDYSPGRYLTAGDPIIGYPLADDKQARSSIVSMGHASNMRVWDGEHINERPTKGPNEMLYAFVLDTLNAVAADMIEIGAVYVYSDGYIIPSSQLYTASDILGIWGLGYKVKEYGNAWIIGVNDYAIGKKKTRRFNPMRDKTYFPFTGCKVTADWLRPKFATIARYRRRVLTGIA